MRNQFAFALVLLLMKTALATPLQLHNQIVFTRDGVWTMNSDGGDQKRVWRVPKGYGKFGGFSRDGKHALSFNRFNLYVHDLQTKHIHRILLWSGGWDTSIGSPSFSPDGKRIVCAISSFAGSFFSRTLCLQADKFYQGLQSPMLAPTGTDVPDDTQWQTPSWSADGKHVALVGGISWSASPPSPICQTDIWTLGADGTGAHRLAHTLAWELEPVWSPDERHIAFVRRTDVVDGGDGYLYAYNLWLAGTKDGSEKSLTSYALTGNEILAHNFSGTSTVVSTPRFSPDGTRIAFQEEKELGKRGSSIFSVDTDGTHLKRLSDGHLLQWIP